MIAQVYETSRVNFLTTFIEGKFQMEFFIGGSQPLGVIYDPKNSFINLGGDPSSPLIYKYQDTGITEFNFNMQAPNYIMEDVGIINLGSAIWEMWIDGDKPYYYYFDRRDSNIFDRTVSVKATKDATTKFKFRLTVLDIVTHPPTLNKYYFDGSTNTIYSSITAKFIPDLSNKQSQKSITVREDTTVKKNRRYLVYALYAKILQLNLDDEDEFEVGDWIEIKNMEFGNFRLNSMKYDIVMKGKSTKGKNGYIQSTLRGDFVRLECMEKSHTRIILSDTNTIGTFTLSLI